MAYLFSGEEKEAEAGSATGSIAGSGDSSIGLKT